MERLNEVISGINQWKCKFGYFIKNIAKCLLLLLDGGFMDVHYTALYAWDFHNNILEESLLKWIKKHITLKNSKQGKLTDNLK